MALCGFLLRVEYELSDDERCIISEFKDLHSSGSDWLLKALVLCEVDAPVSSQKTTWGGFT